MESKEFAEPIRILENLKTDYLLARKTLSSCRSTTGKKAVHIAVSIQGIRRAMIDELFRLPPVLYEMEEKTLAETAIRMSRAVKKFDFLHGETQKITAALEELLSRLKQLSEPAETLRWQGRLINRVKLGYYPTDPEHVARLKSAVTFPDTQVRILDPCCGCGKALAQFAEGTQSVTYGVEVDEARREEALSRLDKAAFGSYFRSNIGSRSFHCVFLNPPYLSMASNAGNIRAEKAFLSSARFHLVSNGVLIYIIPFYRATYAICHMLCEDFRDLTVFRFIGKEYERFRQVVFLGYRKSAEDPAADPQDAQTLYERLLEPEKLPDITELPAGRYQIPDKSCGEPVFQGEIFNIRELEEQLRRDSPEIRKFLFAGSNLELGTKRPLLPLKISQIGLLGGSGMMNGYVDSKFPHVVKGKIIKQKKTEIQTEQTGISVREVTSNRMVIHILTNDGVKRLV